MKIAIVGAGVAGSTLAYLFEREGVEYIIYERDREYRKACGEVVTGHAFELFPPLKRFRGRKIRRVIIAIGGEQFELPAACFPINKKAFIKWMRKQINLNYRFADPNGLKGFDLIVDARGPLTTAKGEIYYGIQAYTRGRFPSNTLFFSLSGVLSGWWIFPAIGGKLNVGSVASDARSAAEKFRELTNSFTKMWEKRSALIKVVNPRGAVEGKIVRIGEAGGFLCHCSGEGIRPAVESAVALFNSIIEAKSSSEVIKRFKRSHAFKVYVRHYRIYKFSKAAELIGLWRWLWRNCFRAMESKAVQELVNRALFPHPEFAEHKPYDH